MHILYLHCDYKRSKCLPLALIHAVEVEAIAVQHMHDGVVWRRLINK